MRTLPSEFETETRRLMGNTLYDSLLHALDEPAPVSIRLNPFKTRSDAQEHPMKPVDACTPVPWCRDAYYLRERPDFTFDPLLHAGLYYVQEASSMFLDHVLRTLVDHPIAMLDLCAAPGGKTTCARAALPAGSILMANEPIRTRAQILSENVQKFGHPDIIVTNNQASDYARTQLQFDIILTDVPCSGEGMFRKDANAISEWSLQHVEKCRQLQREIVSDIWPCLKPGGLLIYSTCTFNAHENEENVAWIASQLDATPIEIPIQQGWNITGSLIDGNAGVLGGRLPVYRFIPGKTRGEGLFMAVLRKKGSNDASTHAGNTSAAATWKNALTRTSKSLRILSWGIKPDTLKGKNYIPDISKALSILSDHDTFPKVEVDYATAICYLRREAVVLPVGAPRGIVAVTYRNCPLGFVKNIGSRANNLYPQEWRIKSTHIPDKIPNILTPSQSLS